MPTKYTNESPSLQVTLKPLIKAGFTAIPLHSYKATRKVLRDGVPVLDKAGKPLRRELGKAPRDSNWTTRDYDSAAVIAECVANGWNVGARIPAGWLVIDIDVRHNGDDGFANLCEDFGLDPSEWPCVRTGSGGRHYFLRIPKGRKISVTLKHEDDPEESDEFNPPRYSGVEFKTIGTQIVTPGSIHPNGNPYKWERSNVADAPGLPADLLEAITRPEREATDGGGHISNERLAAALEGLNPEDFRDHDTWLQILMSCHHCTAGEGREPFLAWSTSDPAYCDAGEEIGRRWDSMHADRKDGVTVASLNRQLVKADRKDLLLPTEAAADVFADDIPFKPEDVFEGTEFEGGDNDDAPDFDRTDAGAVVANSQHNVRTALDALGAVVSYDEFADKIRIEGLKGFGPYLDDAALDRLWLRIDSRFHFRPSREFFTTVTLDYARRRSFHPVRDYFDKVQAQWDGTPRIERMLTTYGGAKDSPFVRAASSLPMIAAVRRVRYPGSKFDEMSVWESAQGNNKSSALEVLAIRPEWFSDSLPLNADSKQTIEAVTGKLIIECADLHGLKRADVDQVKAQLSRQTDRARLAYGRMPVERPRQFVIYGTANSTDYLRDKTGNRRFWPVKVDRFDLVKLRADLDQLWGEAAFRESVGDATRLDPALYKAATEAQAKRTDAKSDPFTDALANVLGDTVGKITGEDVWKILGLTVPGLRTQVTNDRMGAAIRYLGWKRGKFWSDGRAVNGYIKGKGKIPRLYVYGRPGGESYVSTDPLEDTNTRDADE
jgi:hypothetical protein